MSIVGFIFAHWFWLIVLMMFPDCGRVRVFCVTGAAAGAKGEQGGRPCLAGCASAGCGGACGGCCGYRPGAGGGVRGARGGVWRALYRRRPGHSNCRAQNTRADDYRSIYVLWGRSVNRNRHLPSRNTSILPVFPCWIRYTFPDYKSDNTPALLVRPIPCQVLQQTVHLLRTDYNPPLVSGQRP